MNNLSSNKIASWIGLKFFFLLKSLCELISKIHQGENKLEDSKCVFWNTYTLSTKEALKFAARVKPTNDYQLNQPTFMGNEPKVYFVLLKKTNGLGVIHYWSVFNKMKSMQALNETLLISHAVLISTRIAHQQDEVHASI